MKNLEKPDFKTLPKGTKLITRNGRKVSEWHYFETYDSDYPVVAIVENRKYSFCLNGANINPFIENPSDLFIAPKIEEIWVNVYRGVSGRIFTGSAHETEEDAIKGKERNEQFNKSSTWLKTIKITDEI